MAVLLALAAGPASAGDGSWAATTDGLWSTASNWAANTIAFGSGFTATFANDITSDVTVTLDSGRNISAVIFGDANPATPANWTIDGSSNLTLFGTGGSNDATLTVNALGTGATATISTPLNATSANVTGKVIKDGVGTLILAQGAQNTLTAKVEISSGTLQISAANQLGANPASFTADQLTISNGATLRTTTAPLTLPVNRGITIGSGGGTLDVGASGNLIVNGRFTGDNRTVTVTGSGGLSLANNTGGASVVDWVFSMANSQRVFFAGSDSLGTGDVLVKSGIRLVSQNIVPTNGQVTNATTLESGAGLAARVIGAGGAVEYTNVTLPSSGTVIFNQDDVATAALTIASDAALSGDLTVFTSQGGSNAVGDVTLSGIFSGSSGAIIKAGTGASGKLILGGANTYAGNTTVNTGTLALGASGSIDNSASIVVASSATFDVSAVTGYTLGLAQVLTGAGTVVGNVTANGTLAPGLSGGAGTLSFADDLSLGSGSILNFGLDGADRTVGGGVNDLVALTGNLTLDGTINVAEIGAGSFLTAAAGDVWRLFNYSGTLTDNTLSLGTMPSLSAGLSFELNTATPGQVNLAVVPEPASLVTALIGLGLSGIAAARRRRMRIGS